MARREEKEEITIAGHPLSHFEGMTDEEILGIKGIGPKTLEEIRAAQAKAVELTAAVVGDMAEAAEMAERNLGGVEPEVARPQERKCDTCKQPFVPARPEFKHCPPCHTKWQFEQDFKGVEGKLEGVKKAFGRYNDYGPAQALFDEAKAYFIEGNFEAALAALREASAEIDTITAWGSLKYARRLFTEAAENGISVAKETAELANQVEAALLGKGGAPKKPWLAAKNAGKLRDLLQPLASEIREAKDRRERAQFVGAPVKTFVDPDTREALEGLQAEVRRREDKDREQREWKESKKLLHKDKRGRELQAEIEAGLEQAKEERE